MTAAERPVNTVVDAVHTYMDALYDGDVAGFAEAMHPLARLQSVTGGELVLMDRPAYLALVGGRPSPSAMGQERSDKIIEVAVTSPTTAHAVALTHYGRRHFVDSLDLVCLDDRWWIITKTWHHTDEE